MSEHPKESPAEVDVVIVGAGFAGMYQLYRLREAGFNTTVIEAADDVGGTWYWNRYPGARCDILTVDYSYSWDPELQKEWTWSERYATQPEILRYAQHVANKHDLRRDIQFQTRIKHAKWDEDAKRWNLLTDKGDRISAKFYVMATGCLSMPKVPDVPGVDEFKGPTYFTSSWPHEGVDFTGKRVAVIGTGSSGIQSIPLIAEDASQLTVFQRTPNFSFPAHNGPVADARLEEYQRDVAAYRQAARESLIGVPADKPSVAALEVSEEDRNAVYEKVWETGELAQQIKFNDIQSSPEANETQRQFMHNKVREIVEDPKIADLLCPTNHYIFTKRPCLDTNYYQTFNKSHVRLVDLLTQPIATITSAGIDLGGDEPEQLEFDAIVFATGFDAMTGAIVNVDITGRDGLALRDAWSDGPQTYLGLMTAGFPNLFMITGPGSPSVLSNMMVSIEQHVELITDTLKHLRDTDHDSIEPTALAQERWVQHGNEFADLTLLPTANSWYMGRNVPGKPQVFLPYVGGVGRYREICDEIVDRDFLGFTLEGPRGRQSNDGVIRPVKPDMMVTLELIAEAGAPPFESVPVEEARAMADGMGEMFPPGPEVGEVLDGTLPGANGSELEYRLYRPASKGPHPIVVYFHGGGWVLGSHASDDPLCRDLCKQSNAI
uniref:FAD-dependent oxidoreductase n=1 Tax=Congregibacter sp. TaxID=2744308 RepID=UPI003F6AF60E